MAKSWRDTTDVMIAPPPDPPSDDDNDDKEDTTDGRKPHEGFSYEVCPPAELESFKVWVDGYANKALLASPRQPSQRRRLEDMPETQIE